jgi:hypothetical protein
MQLTAPRKLEAPSLRVAFSYGEESGVLSAGSSTSALMAEPPRSAEPARGKGPSLRRRSSGRAGAEGGGQAGGALAQAGVLPIAALWPRLGDGQDQGNRGELEPQITDREQHQQEKEDDDEEDGLRKQQEQEAQHQVPEQAQVHQRAVVAQPRRLEDGSLAAAGALQQLPLEAAGGSQQQEQRAAKASPQPRQASTAPAGALMGPQGAISPSSPRSGGGGDGDGSELVAAAAPPLPPEDPVRRFALSVDVRSLQAGRRLPLNLASAYVQAHLPSELLSAWAARGARKSADCGRRGGGLPQTTARVIARLLPGTAGNSVARSAELPTLLPLLHLPPHACFRPPTAPPQASSPPTAPAYRRVRRRCERTQRWTSRAVARAACPTALCLLTSGGRRQTDWRGAHKCLLPVVLASQCLCAVGG